MLKEKTRDRADLRSLKVVIRAVLVLPGRSKLEQQVIVSDDHLQDLSSGQGRDRTGDTRIFSPVLYQLSYLAITLFTASIKFPEQST